MAPETLESISSNTLLYNNKTDVWTFGVTVWEMYSRGKLKNLKLNKAPDENSSLSYWAIPVIWDHTVLPAARHK